MRLHHVARTIVKQARRTKTTGEEEDDHVHAGMSVLDSVCLTLAVGSLMIAAIWADRHFSLNGEGDILFDGGVTIGSYPTHAFIKGIVVRIASFFAREV